MPLDANLTTRLARELAAADERGQAEPRLVAEARRLLRRVGQLVARGVVAAPADMEALELACYALQLPLRAAGRDAATPGGKLGVVSLRDRTEQAAELLVTTLGGDVDESLLDRATRLLQETSQRTPMTDEAKLLADAVNLDDFGVTGLLRGALQVGRSGLTFERLLDAIGARERYGYYEARLKDGFHFDAARQIAADRLDNARVVAKLLGDEVGEDRSGA